MGVLQMKTLQHFNNFIKEITSSNSRLHKQAVLQKYADDYIIQRYLQIAFDPYKVYGISTKKLYANVPPHVATDVELFDVFELFEYLEKHNTGTFQEILLCQNLLDGVAAVDRECAELLESLICKDLSIGCDAKTINKEIPGCIRTFSCQLANKYFDKPAIVEGKKFAITTKIDGGRIIALKENGQVSFYTRAGQRYEGLVDLEREMQWMPDNTCLDGEITLFDSHGMSSKEQYKETMKIVRTKDKEKHGIKMLVFDWMPADDFKRQQCDVPYRDRRAEVTRLICNYRHYDYFRLLPLLYVGEDTSMITEILEDQVAAGEEGIMINIYDAPYEFKRTTNLLKCKKMDTLDLEVIGFEEGSGRLAGTLGAILVRYKNDNVVKVGSGFSDAQRAEIWNNQADWLGAIIECQYFEETKNADGGISLRFPVFKSRRTDKLEADF
jgi:DNA ligase-1